MMRLFLYFTSLIFIGTLSSCVPYNEGTTEVELDFRDSINRKIFDLQDQQNVSQLLSFFEEPNATYRYLSAMAFASIRDKTYNDSLYQLLYDPVDKVRSAAAYAIGQTGDSMAVNSLIRAFNKEDTAGYYKLSNSAILEAVGKCGDDEILKLLSSIKTYDTKDTLLLLGQSYGIYRMALRNITSPAATAKMIEYVTNNEFPQNVRLVAANYLYRARNIKIDSIQAGHLGKVLLGESDPYIKMALATAIGKVPNDQTLKTLKSVYSNETDYRVKTNIIRALGNYDYAQCFELTNTALSDKNPHVQNRAAQYFVENGQNPDASVYWKWAKDTSYQKVSALLYQAANKYLPIYQIDYRNSLNYEIRTRYTKEQNPYIKAQYLRALGEFPWNYRFIFREIELPLHPYVKNTAIEVCDNIARRADFDKYFNTASSYVQKEFVESLLGAIKTKDVGLVYTAANALNNPDRNFKEILQDSVSMLTKLANNMDKIETIEAKYAIDKLIAFLQDKEPTKASPPPFSHPINWAVFNNIIESPKCEINTSKGKIILKMMPNEAPGTVANFIELSKKGFYDGKNFHRVVPNFVIQGGCSRGDGFGGLNYSIRSELAYLHYDAEGYVGMASAGNHTEGSQFFITQSPTLHLDGNYTIFAKVIEGMDVVHQIEVGDIIQTVIIK